MKRRVLILSSLALALLGCADAWYLADAALTNAPLSCSIVGLDGCNIVAKSSYSHVFGVPLGVYGLVFYGVFFLLALVALKKPLRKFDIALFILGTAGALMSAYFLYIQFVLIKALCIYCLASAGISFLLWAMTMHLWRYSHSQESLATLASL